MKHARDIVFGVLAAILVGLLLAGLVLIGSAVLANRTFIQDQCEANLRQDRKLAGLVRVSRPVQTPEALPKFNAYLDGVARERRKGCDV